MAESFLTPQGSSSGRRLSKSRCLSGIQCAKRLYLDVHSPELATKTDVQRQAILEMGREIGEAARRLFPEGTLVDEDYRHTAAALNRTAELLADPNISVIFEGAFQFQGTLVRVDVLERVEHQCWRLIEVKAASRVKAVHLHDLTIQTYVLQGVGVELEGSYVMNVNRRYRYLGGHVDLHHLFSLHNLTEAVSERILHISQLIHDLKEVVALPAPPSIEPDAHCHRPFSCPFWDFCIRDKSKRWIFHLPGERKIFKHLKDLGIESIDDIPEGFSLTILQRRVRDNVEWISQNIQQELSSVEYPVHHLDFETFMPAIPLYPDTYPYQPLPVQWSNHTEYHDASLRHEGYICREQKDPREEVAISVLESLGQEGSICVYSDYERYVLASLAEVVPSLKKELHQVIGRLWDLLSVIQTHYYHPKFNGSFSIKAVLPALLPTLGYDDLEVQNGASASAFYNRMLYQETDWVERDRIATALLQYCARDTFAMVKLRHVLMAKANGSCGSQFIQMAGTTRVR